MVVAEKAPWSMKIQDDEVTEFIRIYIAKSGYSPSVRDIAERFEVSTSTIHRHLMDLVEDGKLSVDRGRARTWRTL